MAWETDNYAPQIDGIQNGLYLYFMNDGLVDYADGQHLDNQNNLEVLGNSCSIVSIIYTPFVKEGDLELHGTPYDTERFGKLDESRPEIASARIPYVYRITSLKNKNWELGTLATPDLPSSYAKEKKLLKYPFTYSLVTDYANEPLLLKEQHIVNRSVMVTTSISDKCTYAIYNKGYNGDYYGNVHGMISKYNWDLPCSSSAYAQFSATSKAQFNMNQLSQMVHNVLPSIPTRSGMNVNNGLGLTAMNSGIGAMDLIGQSLAIKKDLMNTPNSLTKLGGDVNFTVNSGNKKVDQLIYQIDDYHLKNCYDYFTYYGYKQNRIMDNSILYNRNNFNYIKTISANITGNDVPKDALEDIKNIFNKGVTLWHMDRKNCSLFDYQTDNFEV